MRLRSALLTASSALVLTACGGGEQREPTPRPPRIPAGLAAQLAAEAERVAELPPQSCQARDAAIRLQQNVIASIGRVPSRYQEPLQSAANDLVDRLSRCVAGEDEEREHGKGRGHGKGKGKKHGEGE
jgi:hypothetical protein